MIDYISDSHKCHARKCPPIRGHWTQKRSTFDRFVATRLIGAKIHDEQKRIIIEHKGKMWCLVHGQYLVFRDDGKVMVMFPSSFHDVWKKDAA